MPTGTSEAATVGPWLLAGSSWLVATAVMLACWASYRRRRNAGIVDVGWAAALVMVALVSAVLRPGTRTTLLAGMIAVWGVRLAWYLLRDRVIGRPEDGRYVSLRERWGAAAERRFFWFFQAQAVLVVVLSLPVILNSGAPSDAVGAVQIAAVALWSLALVGEAVADRQLERFKRRPDARRRTCRDGLWRYSRHPNYFFEWLVWVAYALFAATSPNGLWAFAAPAVILYLLFRVTGIPATEAQALKTRGADYRLYQSTTSPFIPWIPKDAG